MYTHVHKKYIYSDIYIFFAYLVSDDDARKSLKNDEQFFLLFHQSRETIVPPQSLALPAGAITTKNMF